MSASYVVGLGALIAVALGWVAVQRAWRRAFGDVTGDPDALAGRPGCAGCGCAGSCEREGSGTSPIEEERR